MLGDGSLSTNLRVTEELPHAEATCKRKKSPRCGSDHDDRQTIKLDENQPPGTSKPSSEENRTEIQEPVRTPTPVTAVPSTSKGRYPHNTLYYLYFFNTPLPDEKNSFSGMTSGRRE